MSVVAGVSGSAGLHPACMLGRCTYDIVDGTLKLTIVSGAFEGKSGKKREKLVMQASSTTPAKHFTFSV